MNKQLRYYYNEICQTAVEEIQSTGLGNKITTLMSVENEEQVQSTIMLLSSLTEAWLCFYLVIDRKNGQFGINPNFYITMDVFLEEILTNPIWKPFLDAGMFGGIVGKAFGNTKIEKVKKQLDDPQSIESMAVRFLSAMVLIPQLGIEVGQYEVTGGLYYQVYKHKKTSSDPVISAMNDWSLWNKDISKPAGFVSWYDCILWCNAFSVLQGLQPAYTITYKADPSEQGANFTLKGLNQLLGSGSEYEIDTVSWNRGANGYRLLTEEEWYYCASANTNFTYAGSNDPNEVAWYDGNSGGRTHGVGQKKANGFGLYDMSGNVEEWVWDQGKFKDTRVYRGGSKSSSASKVQVSSSSNHMPRFSSGGFGFRICRNLS